MCWTFDDRLEIVRKLIIPQRLKVIATARQMISLESEYSPHSIVHLIIEQTHGVNIDAYSDALATITQPIIDSAILHCRCLLDFVGIGLDSKSDSLVLSSSSRKRQKDDIGIEYFKSAGGKQLRQLTPQEAISLLSDDTIDLNQAWATVIKIANQRLAHSTEDKMLSDSGDITPMLVIAFDSLPDLIGKAFYGKIQEKAEPQIRNSA